MAEAQRIARLIRTKVTELQKRDDEKQAALAKEEVERRVVESTAASVQHLLRHLVTEEDGSAGKLYGRALEELLADENLPEQYRAILQELQKNLSAD